MRIIDTHVHVFPDRIAHAAVAATGEFYANAHNDQLTAPEDLTHGLGNAEDLLARMSRAGIGRAVIFSTATTPHQVESINSFIAGLCQEHGEFIGLGTMHIDYPDFAGEVRRMKKLGLRGLKLHPDIQHFYLDDDRLLPLYDSLRSEHMYLISHTGDYRYDYSSPARLARLAKLFPDMRFVGAHFGGWSQWREARECLQLPNVYVDTSSTISFGGRDAAIEGLRTFDPTHIFFGTDYPMWDPKEELDRFLALDLPEDLLRMVLSENYERFLEEL